MKFGNILFLGAILFTNVFSQEIILHKTSVKVWGVDQEIKGEILGFNAGSGSLFLNETQIDFTISDQVNFNVPIVLGEGENELFVIISNNGNPIYSDTISLSLGYQIKPTLFAYPIVDGESVTLHSQVLENPDNSIISYQWSSDPNNLIESTIVNPNDAVSSVTFQNQIVDGEYYFDLLATTNHNDTVKVRTLVTVKSNEIVPYNILTDHAAWIDSAIIYEITPYNFVNPRGNFNQVKKKIPDFVRLGVNTLWIQPIYKTYNGGQGYDVIDYFNIREDYGTEEELIDLIKEAKANNLRVIFDFVPNHSSIWHPYARHSIIYGEDSHYWEYYQRETDNAPYSQHYSFYSGFINYFWDQLPNLNFNNPEVQKWISEGIKYWVEKYNIDGYRFDAVWGTNARNPQFMKDVRFMLKSFKPEVLMLAEDKATWAETFDENFDVAFDWYPEEDWVSHWTWQTNYSSNGNQTIFNSSSENSRQRLLREALTNKGNGYSQNAKILRFMGNNDIYHFITHHGLERTKMAAGLLFTLNGIPMIYNGQEIGVEGHPYSTEYLFFPGYPIDYSDQYNLFPYYQRLIEIRKTYSALMSNNFEELVTDNSSYSFAFRRWIDNQNIVTVMNMKSTPIELTVTLPIEDLELDSTKNYYLTELLTGEVISGDVNSIAEFSVAMNGFNSKIYLLADSIETVTSTKEIALQNNSVPAEFSLSQNYPNPFNLSTTIEFNIPNAGHMQLLVYNILGELITELRNQHIAAGEHSVQFNATGLASGVYFSQLRFENKIITKKMFLLK